MKKGYFIFWLLSFAALAAPKGTYAQTRDSCLWLLPPDSLWSNPDSLMTDTCLSSPTYNNMYAFRWFRIFFSIYALKLPAYPADTIIEVPWTDIDTAYPNIRAGFQALQNRFGAFILHKTYPDDTDSLNELSRKYEIRFNNYVDVDSAIRALDSIPGIYDVAFDGKVGGYTTVRQMQNSLFTENQLVLYPNPAQNILEISVPADAKIKKGFLFDCLGRIFATFETKAGMPPNIPINVGDLPNGVYFVRFGSIVRQFIINR